MASRVFMVLQRGMRHCETGGKTMRGVEHRRRQGLRAWFAVWFRNSQKSVIDAHLAFLSFPKRARRTLMNTLAATLRAPCEALRKPGG